MDQQRLFHKRASVLSSRQGQLTQLFTRVTVTILVLSQCQVTSYPQRVGGIEPLSRHGCVWSNTRSALGSNDMSLNCNVRTLSTEFWNYTFSAEQRQSTTMLQVKCNDKLYFESHLKLNQSFSQLVHLHTVSFDYCKIRKVPRGIWNRFAELRSLGIRSRNSDWSPSIGLELESNCFQGLTQLMSLDLSLSNVWTLPDQLLCPQLTNLLKFNLSSNRLIDLPDEFSSENDFSSNQSTYPCVLNLQNLDVSRNAIRRIGKSALSRLPSLTQLRLQQNLIEELQDSAFSGLSQLRYLNLSSNRLVALPPTIFKSNPMLRELYLQNNSITALSPTVFLPLGQLVMLDLSRNALSSLWIKDTVFHGLSKLIVLRLSFNQLAVIDGKIFKALTNLQALYMDSNRIETIEPEALSSLTNLHLLDLSRNRLSTIDGRLLGSTGLLQSLFLDHNKITFVSPGALDNCTNLQDIGLSGNHLREVPSALQSGLTKLRSLDLGENRIGALTNESFAGLEEVYGLRIVDNRINELPPGFCLSLKRLRVLNLAQNRINKVSRSAFTGCPELRALRLDTNSLEEIPASLVELPALLWLNISENKIRVADYNDLPPSVEWLDLSFNLLETLGSKSVSGGSSSVSMSKNVRNPIPSSTFHLRVLDASFNRLTKLDVNTIPPSLETLRINHNILHAIAAETFSRSAHLRRIELVGNQLEVISLSAFTFPSVPASRPLPELFVSGNPFRCDCTMEWLPRLNQYQLAILRQHPHLSDLESVKCKLSTTEDAAFSSDLVPIQDVKPSQFLCPYTTQCFPLCHCCDFEACDCHFTCPVNCSCFHDTPWSVNIVHCSNLDYQVIPPRIPMEATEIRLDGNQISQLGSHIFIGKKNLKSLFLNGSSVELIRNKTFNGLRSLETLHLEDNLLSGLSGWEFKGLSALRELYLQNNRLESIAGETFDDLKFLQTLRIDDNRLVDFNVWELSGNGYLKSLSLSSNPWSCECDFVIPFRSWMISKSSIVVDLTLAMCQLIPFEGDNGTGTPSTLDSICNNELDKIPSFDGVGNNALGQIDGNEVGSNPEKQAVLQNDDSDSNGNGMNPTDTDTDVMDFDTSVLLAIVLCSIVGVVLVIALVFIFRKEVSSILCRSRIRNFFGIGKKDTTNTTNGSGTGTMQDKEIESEKLFDAYLLYNSEDEELLREKLTPELEEENKGSSGPGRNRFRLCFHRDLCLGLENPWNLEMVLSAGEASRRIVILLSKTFLQREWTNNSDFRRALQLTLSRHQKKVIFILLPPLTVQNVSTLLTIFPELQAAVPNSTFSKNSFSKNSFSRNSFSKNSNFETSNVLEWTDPQFKSKIRRLLPPSVRNEMTHVHHHPPPQHLPSVQSILSHQLPHQNVELGWPHPLHTELKQQSLVWSHHNHNHQHCHSNHPPPPSIMTRRVSHGFVDSVSMHPPIMFPGQSHPPPLDLHPHSHSHEHQNSVSTISNTYPPLTEQNLSDSTNTLGSMGSEEHVYSTLDTPLQSPQQICSATNGAGSSCNKRHSEDEDAAGPPESPSGHMYFV